MKKKIMPSLFILSVMAALAGTVQADVVVLNGYPPRYVNTLPITSFFSSVVWMEHGAGISILYTNDDNYYNQIDNYDPEKDVAFEFMFDSNRTILRNNDFKLGAPEGTFKDGYGFSLSPAGSSNSPATLIIDFSRPMGYFIVDFINASKRITGPYGADLSQPALLRFYEGLHGTGKRIAGISHIDYLSSLGIDYHNSFLGLMSKEVNIQSVVVESAGPDYGFCIDDLLFSTSLRQVPEPSTWILFTTGMAGAGWFVLKRRSRLEV